ncbi:MAG: ABC transporter ATP-binding protein [Alphaproteobacteria bacterium]|nr:ABC transporter ATP-binding protein [Alphaproteobacteria bacterium]
MANLSLRNISKDFGSIRVLRGLSLDIADGEFISLLGPSGCGKSTLLRIIAGLEHQSAGDVMIADRPVDRLPPKRRDVAMVFQSYALYPHMTVQRNLSLPLRIRRLSQLQRLPFVGRMLPGTRAISAEIDSEVEAVATSMEIAHLLHRKPAQLSGGQRQRVALGRAIVRQPAVFLMDEPLSNLDAKLRVAMRAEITELHRKLGITFIYVTHDQVEAMTMSDRVAIMLDGELLQVAPPAEIYADPVNLQVAQFVGSPRINVIPGVAGRENQIEVLGAAFEFVSGLAEGAEVQVAIRPEAMRFAEPTSAFSVSGSIQLIEHLGSDVYVHLKVPGCPEPVLFRTDAEHGSALEFDETVSVAPSSLDAVLLFDKSGDRVRAAKPVVVDIAQAGAT